MTEQIEQAQPVINLQRRMEGVAQRALNLAGIVCIDDTARTHETAVDRAIRMHEFIRSCPEAHQLLIEAGITLPEGDI
jgi:hypothetical protein